MSRYLWRAGTPSLRRASRRTGRTQRGQALLELAIIAPVLMLLLLAALDLGRVFYAQITVANAARAGAFEAADSSGAGPTVSCGPHGAIPRATCAAVNEALNSSVTVDPGDVQVACDPAGCARVFGNRVSVTVTGHFELLTPVLWVFTGGPDITFAETAHADMVYRPPASGAGMGSGASAPPSASPGPGSSASPDPGSSASPAPSATAAPTPAPCAAPLVSFTYSQQNKNRPVDFSSAATPSGGPCAVTFWRWDYGDGETDAGNNPTPSHTFPQQGTDYLVTLSATNPGGTVSWNTTVRTK